MSASIKTALITGSTSGIGLACAHALAKRGVNIILNGSRDITQITGVIDEIKQYGVKTDYLQADLSKVSDIDSLWQQVLQIYPNGIDILVNNAGALISKSIEETTDIEYDFQVAIVLSAPFHLIKRCLPFMKQKGWGRIVNVSSIRGLVGNKNCVAYNAARHGMHGLTKGVALENAAFGITCNAICPHLVRTPMLQKFCEDMAKAQKGTTEEAEKQLLSEVPTGKFTEPEQVAELVEFLSLSHASSQITGSTYTIDQGYTAQ